MNRLAKIQEIKKKKNYPLTGKINIVTKDVKQENSIKSNNNIDKIAKDLRLIEEKLLKTEITQGLQISLDISCATNDKNFKEEWNNDDTKDEAINNKTINSTNQALLANIFTNLKKNSNHKNKLEISTSMKRKLENDEEIKVEFKPKILKFDEYAKESENKSNLNLNLNKKHTQMKPNLKAQTNNSKTNTKSKFTSSQLTKYSKTKSATKVNPFESKSNSKFFRNSLKPDEIQPSGKRIKPEVEFNSS